MEEKNNIFKIIGHSDNVSSLVFDFDRAREGCEYVLQNNIERITIMPDKNRTKNNLVPLLPIKDYITGLLLDPTIDYSELHQFKRLKLLSVPDNKKNIVDLSAFNSLESLSCNYSNRLIGLEKCIYLRHLTLNNYSSISNDLTSLPKLQHLDVLWLFNLKISSLNGIDISKKIKKIFLYGSRSLSSIRSLSTIRDTIEEIQIEKCKNISDYEYLGELKQLKKIMLTDAGKIKSLNFINNFPILEYFVFFDMIIKDGDLSCCDKIRYVRFDNKKHYNRKVEFFKK